MTVLPPEDLPELVEPGPAADSWDETPAQAAAADRAWFDHGHDHEE